MIEKFLKRTGVVALLLSIIQFTLLPSSFGAQDPVPLKAVGTIPMPGVKGRIDHMSADLERKRLFVAAYGNNTVEVIDMIGAKHINTIKGLREPQGVLYLPEFRKLVVANGKDGSCMIFDGDSLRLITTLKLSGDADNIRYDRHSKLVYIGHGDGALGIIDIKNDKHISDIRLAGQPESFESGESGAKIYVNVPSASHVAVIDLKSRSIEALWPLGCAKGNFPMALDERDNRLYVGCRYPPEILVVDTVSGATINSLDAAPDLDDIYYDTALGRIYATGGGGFLIVFQKTGANRYTLLAKIPAPAGARTSLFIPELGRLYLAVPKSQKTQPAEVRVYEVNR